MIPVRIVAMIFLFILNPFYYAVIICIFYHYTFKQRVFLVHAVYP